MRAAVRAHGVARQRRAPRTRHSASARCTAVGSAVAHLRAGAEGRSQSDHRWRSTASTTWPIRASSSGEPVAPGKCYRLYTERAYRGEMLSTLQQLKTMGIDGSTSSRRRSWRLDSCVR